MLLRNLQNRLQLNIITSFELRKFLTQKIYFLIKIEQDTIFALELNDQQEIEDVRILKTQIHALSI